jgi:hypothetical protein
MTSPTQPPVEATDIVDSASAEGVEKAEIPAFKFPFRLGRGMRPNRGTKTAPRMAIPSRQAWRRRVRVVRWVNAEVNKSHVLSTIAYSFC